MICKKGVNLEKPSTVIFRQTDGSYDFGEGDLVVETKQSNVVVEMPKTEISGEGAYDETRFGLSGARAPIVFTQGHLNHEPHEPAEQAACRSTMKMDHGELVL